MIEDITKKTRESEQLAHEIDKFICGGGTIETLPEKNPKLVRKMKRRTRK